MKKQKELHELTFDELVTIAAGQALERFVRGESSFRSVIYSACDLGARWSHGQKKSK